MFEFENKNNESNYVVERIGSTLYKIKICFSENAKETMEEKLLRIIKNDALYSEKQFMEGQVSWTAQI